MSELILVVEDQEDNRQILRDLLKSADYTITEAETGEEAITAVARQPPGLILMDIQLPGIDGYEATRRIKSDPALCSIPIIAVTSYALSGDEDKCREAGCVTDWRAMRDRVEEAIKTFSSNPPPLPIDEVAEANQFLQWLCADNFTFLGVREYRFSPDSDARTTSRLTKASASCAIRMRRFCAAVAKWW